jgi:hypothetical protein
MAWNINWTTHSTLTTGRNAPDVYNNLNCPGRVSEILGKFI